MSDQPETPLPSKKFRAFLTAEISWKIILALVVLLSFLSGKGIGLYGFLSVMTIILIAGFIEVVYLGTQASLDKYVKVAEIAVNAGKAFVSKGIAIPARPEPESKDAAEIEVDEG